MPAHHTGVITIEELLALPEDGMRHELLAGEHVVTPAPRLPHQAVLGELFQIVREVLADRGDLQVFFSPADVVLGPGTLVQPDLFVAAREPGTVLEAWSDVGVPVLAVEILSPSTAARDRGKKRRIYQDAGVGQYWIVDLDARLVERWTAVDKRPEIIDHTMNWKLADGSVVSFPLSRVFGVLDPET